MAPVCMKRRLVKYAGGSAFNEQGPGCFVPDLDEGIRVGAVDARPLLVRARVGDGDARLVRQELLEHRRAGRCVLREAYRQVLDAQAPGSWRVSGHGAGL